MYNILALEGNNIALLLFSKYLAGSAKTFIFLDILAAPIRMWTAVYGVIFSYFWVLLIHLFISVTEASGCKLPTQYNGILLSNLRKLFSPLLC